MQIQLRNNRAFSYLELVIILALVAVLAAMLLPALSKARSKASYISCISNLKQVGIGFRLHAMDNAGTYPEFNETNQAWNYFQTVGIDIGSPRVLICPQDDERLKRKIRPLDFEETDSTNNFSHPIHQNAALSYFYGADADEESNPNALLAGDRNISTNDHILTGVLTVRSNSPLRWTWQIHTNKGNVALADGSAHPLVSPQFQEQLGAVTNEFQRLILP